MARQHLRLVALALLLCFIPGLSGCGGGIVETALTVRKLYGLWQLYKLFDDGQPSWLQVASAVFKLGKTLDYTLDYVDAQGAVVESEAGTWDVESGVLVLNVAESTIDPSAVGRTLRLPGEFTDSSANELAITRRVVQGQVTVSQEQVYRRASG